MVASIGDVGIVTEEGKLTTSIDHPPRAQFLIRNELIATSTIDFFAPVRVTIGEDLVFTGVIVRVATRAEGIDVFCQEGLGLTEREMPGLVAEEVPVQDIVYAAARSAGFDDDHLDIDGLDELPVEVFEIIVPIQGIAAPEPRQIGRVWIGPRRVEALADFSSTEDIAEPLENADVEARVVVTASRLYQAETEGLAEIDLVLNWLTTRGHYGLALLPDGSRQRYLRGEALGVPDRGDLVIAWASRRAMSIWATLAPRCLPSRRLVR